METLEKKDILRGGQFLVKESDCEDIFTPEDFTEEQQMMRDAVKEFNDREIIPYKDRFEKKDYALTEQCMKKAGDLGFLGVAVPEEYGGLGMGFVSTMLVCEYILVVQVLLALLLEHIQELEPCQLPYMEMKSKEKICSKIGIRRMDGGLLSD